MANINEVFDEKQNETSTYFEVPGNAKSSSNYQPTIPGTYFGHIQDVETRIVEFNNYKARVYNFKVKVASENSKCQYPSTDINGAPTQISGSNFVGRIFRSSGVFRFLEPGKEDKFKSNPTGNRGYLSLCQAMGIKCDEKEQVIDGKKVKVKTLPSINTSDIEGMPVAAEVKPGKPYTDKNGNQRHYFDVKWVNEWADGKKMESGADDEIPF